MTKVDIFSGFLGAGKTTLIKKLIAEAYAGEKLVLIENEFGEIGVDGGFMKEAGIEVTEMNSGCICCSLVGDFDKALREVLETYHPDRILIEPSGVGKLSDVMQAVLALRSDELFLNACVTVADAGKCKLYMKNFGEFFNNQVEYAGVIVLSRTDALPEGKLADTLALLRAQNAVAPIITTPWSTLDGKQILAAMEGEDSLAKDLEHLVQQAEHCPGCGEPNAQEPHHKHHHHDHGHEHTCDCAHEEHEHTCDCAHRHEQEDAHDQEHVCTCGHDHHHHEHEHDADEIFSSWGVETAAKYSKEVLTTALEALANEKKYGFVLRAKGMLPARDGAWLHFDYVPGEVSVREGAAALTGRLCVIGTALHEEALAKLFGQV